MFEQKYYYSLMSPKQRRWLRVKMVEEQGHKCWYCGNFVYMPPPEHIANYKYNMKRFPPNMLKHPVHLHHDHKTDECLGAVHAKCNMYMWEVDGN